MSILEQQYTAAMRAAVQSARALMAEGQAVSAELALRALVERFPQCVEGWMLLTDLAELRGDAARARECARNACAIVPENEALAINIAQVQLESDRPADAAATLASLLARVPDSFMAWIMLGDVFHLSGQAEPAFRARVQGITRGQAAGKLMNLASTPQQLQPVITDLIGEVNHGRAARVAEGLARMREQLGADELKRVEHAMAAYLGLQDDGPANPNQRPKFLFFPGLPEGPYHDPYLHAWAGRLDDAYGAIRAEALAVLERDQGMENFLSFKPGQSTAGYLGGDGEKPSWDAFFFYRHGEHYAANHARCPATSAALGAVELCEVAGQAPEICFSVLQPGTHIMPHHGVTNTRLVMHLPLVVPADCALNVFGGGEHAWQEGKLMMFDDTFRHEAWNRSAQTRVILLMDCWNPHLGMGERVAVRHLTELISQIDNFPQAELDRIVAALQA